LLQHTAALNIIPLILIAFFLSGLSFVHYVMKVCAVHYGYRIAYYVVLLFFTLPLLVMTILIGLVDTVYALRPVILQYSRK
jgi:hypothetical protein